MFVKTRSTAPAGSLLRCAELNGQNSSGPLVRKTVVAGFQNNFVADFQNGAPSQKFYGIDSSANILLYDTSNPGAGIQTWMTASAVGYTIAGITISPDNTALYVCVTQNKVLKIVTSSKAVSVLAGSGTAGTNDGTGAAAQFDNPVSLAMDPLGNYLLVIDRASGKIRNVVVATGVVTTGNTSPGGAGLLGGTVQVSIDKQGYLWFTATADMYRVNPAAGGPSAVNVASISGVYITWVVPDDDEPGPTNFYFGGEAIGTIVRQNLATTTDTTVANSGINVARWQYAQWRNPGLYFVDASLNLSFLSEYWT